MGFNQSLSGLHAASQHLEVITNNIANSSTNGFKGSTVSFQDVYGDSKIGMGVAVAAVKQNFTAGNIKSTGGQFDIAIDGAKGFFRLVDESGNVRYSRNGEFQADKNGKIVNAQGLQLTGYAGINNVTSLTPLAVPYGNLAPLPTGQAALKTNFDASADPISATAVPETLGQVTLTDTVTSVVQPTAYYKQTSTGVLTWYDSLGVATAAPANGDYTSGAGVNVKISGGQITSGTFSTAAPDVGYVAAKAAHPFSSTDPDSYSHSMPMQVYDSLGNSHQMEQYFVKRSGGVGSQSDWEAYYTIDGKPVDTPVGGGPVSVTFDTAGRMTSPPTSVITFLNPGSAATPADPMSITIDYTGSTQFAGSFTPTFTQNGYASGEYSGVSIDVDGSMIASYTNGQTKKIATVALANFMNVNGLQPIGGNAWVETGSSGQPLMGTPGQNGLAQLKGQALEESNVDTSKELVDMITAQRDYQSNAQGIKTNDQLMQTILQIH